MQLTLNNYLDVPYVDNGRDLTGFDCWGQTRHIAHHFHKLPLFTSFGHVHPDDKSTLHSCFEEIAHLFTSCSPKEKSIACGFRGGNLVHMGTCVFVDGELQIIHTSRKSGPAIISIEQFKRLFLRVRFYEYNTDQGLSKQT